MTRARVRLLLPCVALLTLVACGEDNPEEGAAGAGGASASETSAAEPTAPESTSEPTEEPSDDSSGGGDIAGSCAEIEATITSITDQFPEGVGLDDGEVPEPEQIAALTALAEGLAGLDVPDSELAALRDAAVGAAQTLIDRGERGEVVTAGGRRRLQQRVERRRNPVRRRELTARPGASAGLTRPRRGATLTGPPHVPRTCRPCRGGSSGPDRVVWANSEDPMAKALLGHVGGPDPRLVDEVRRLRRRVIDLETEIGRLLVERDLFTEVALERSLARRPIRAQRRTRRARRPARPRRRAHLSSSSRNFTSLRRRSRRAGQVRAGV